MKQEDFLVEILTEELPPAALHRLGQAFFQQVSDRLQKLGMTFNEKESTWFATPRRLAVFIRDLPAAQPDQKIERRGPALSAAFDASGKPTPACMGFAKSCGVEPAALNTIKNEQGEWLAYSQDLKGKAVSALMPEIVEQAVSDLPVPKYMRWGHSEVTFARPVHSVLMLYGDEVVPATLLGCQAGRTTHGHRFMSPGVMTIPTAAAYESLLETEGMVIADFMKRRQLIEKQAVECAHREIGKQAKPMMSDALLDEVAGLVEWPHALCGHFDEAFLSVPQEVLISAMEAHQRYFPVSDGETLLANFIVISNIQSSDMSQVVQGNERVLRARLSDAAFFFETDKKEKMIDRLERLKNIVYQAKLGSLYDRAERLSALAAFIAEKTDGSLKDAKRAGMLAKADLTSNMVGEFPELQGIMGSYYAKHDGESADVALAMKEQYLPRFSGDVLPVNTVGRALALADKIDALAGSFVIDQIPTGDKDPFGLRRAAIGVIRMLVESEINLELNEVFEKALVLNAKAASVSVSETVFEKLIAFTQERLRSWYLEKGVSPDVLAAVLALNITNPLDIDQRLKAVQAFKKLEAAEALSIANKRVSNILEKQALDSVKVNPALFEHDAERMLLSGLEQKQQAVEDSCQHRQYDTALKQLAELRQPIDDFFDNVMVMTDNEAQRTNRIVLLGKLRKLFLQVADIALLQ